MCARFSNSAGKAQGRGLAEALILHFGFSQFSISHIGFSQFSISCIGIISQGEYPGKVAEVATVGR